MTHGAGRLRRLARRITVVGEQPTFLEAVTERLEEGGYEVTCLVPALDVAARIIQTHPDLVCVHVESSADAPHAHWALEEPDLVAIPVVVLSDVEVAGSMPRDDHRQPTRTNLDELLARVQAAMARTG